LSLLAWLEPRIGPILVKELRQGLRSRGFMISFITLQVLMLFAVFGAVGDRVSGRMGAPLFWTMLGLLLLIVQPLRGFQALQSELRNGTLELVMLTRLTARRIVAGKWTALCAQSLLMVVAVLPFVVVRYFVGSVDLVQEMIGLTTVIGLSAVLCAATVAFSAVESRLFRIGVILLTVLLLWGGPAFLFGSMLGGRHGGGSGGYELAIILAAYAPLAILVMLEWGAERIAPAAENHAARLRLGVLGLLAVHALLRWGWGSYDDEWSGVFLVVILTPFTIDALLREPRLLPVVVQPFLRRGLPGRLAARFLLPGWPFALLFVLLVQALFWLCEIAELRRDDDALAAMFGVLGLALFPVGIARIFRLTGARAFAVFVGLQILMIGLFVFAKSMERVLGSDLLEILSIFPTTGLIGSLDGDASWAMTGIGALVGLLLLVLAALRPWGELRKMERELRNPPAPEGEAPATA
jgi:ABC-type transport system involved in multi-copper enzyme maturation permease subunit